MYMPSRTLTVVDVYEQLSLRTQVITTDIAVCLMVQYLNNLDTEDLTFTMALLDIVIVIVIVIGHVTLTSVRRAGWYGSRDQLVFRRSWKPSRSR